MKELTLEDFRPLVAAMFDTGLSWALTDALEEVRLVADEQRTAIAESRRLTTDAPDGEPATDALFFAMCDTFKLDPFGIGIPGVPDDRSLEEITWTLGLYRALFAEVFPDPDSQAIALERIRNRSAWQALFHDAAAALREDDPPPPPDGCLPELDELAQPLTLAETAAALGIREETVGRYLKSGELRGGRVGRRWRIPRAAVDAFLRGGRR